MWDHSHINNDTHRLPHIWPYIFTPYISPKPLFLPKIVTQSHSVTLSKCPEFWKFFTQRPLIGWNLRKRYPNAAYFVMACHWKTPYFFAFTHVCLRGMLPQTRSAAGKFCILETESSNLGNTFRCKFNKGNENKISFLQAQPTQLCIIWMNFIGGQGWYRLYYPPSRTVASLSLPGGQDRTISSIFSHFPVVYLIFTQIFFIFFLILVFRVGGSPTREGPGYATAT